MPAAAPSAPGPEEPSGDRSTVGDAVERFLASLRSATTRTSYARTLARLTTVAARTTRSPTSSPTTTPPSWPPGTPLRRPPGTGTCPP
ncbi:hypothetical protein ACFQ0B_46560 [Nonomuraea thailandensis]